VIQLRLLGPIELRDSADEEITGVLVQPKRFALLVYLAAARPRGFRRRDSLLGLFWPELDETHARQALKQTVSVLRRSLGDTALRNRGAEEIAIDSTILMADVATFADHVAAGRFDEAMTLYRGDLLEGFFVDGAAGFHDWLDRERAYLRALAAHAARENATRRERDNDLSGATASAQRALDLSDMDERVLRELMVLLDKSGDRTGAVRAYERFAGRLAAEYDASSAPETRALLAQIRESEPPRRDASNELECSTSTQAPITTPVRPVLVRRRDWRRARHTWLAITAVVCVVVTALTVLARQRSAALPPPGVVVAIFPPTVTGIDVATTSRPYSELPYLIGYTFDNATGVRAANVNAVLDLVDRRGGSDAVRNPDVARAVARDAGANYLLYTLVYDRGDSLKLIATLEPLASSGGGKAIKVEANDATAKLDRMLSDLVGRLLAARENGRVARFGNVAAKSTDSLAALVAYLEGERLLRDRWLDSAATAFRRAVTIDTAFALAYYRLAVIGGWGVSVGISAREAAIRHLGRLPRRYQTLVHAFDAFWAGRATEAESLYTEITRWYPDDREAWFHLGDVLFHYKVPWGGAISDARAAFERALGRDSTDVEPLNHLLWIAAIETRYDEAARIAERVKRYDLGEYGRLATTSIAFYGGDPAMQAAMLQDVRRFTGWKFPWMASGFATFVGSFDGAKRVANLLKDEDRPAKQRAIGHQLVIDLELAQGHRDSAAVENDRLMRAFAGFAFRGGLLYALSPVVLDFSGAGELRALRGSIRQWPRRTLGDSVRAMYLNGILSARLGDTVTALATARILARSSTDTAPDLAATVRAEVARYGGHFQEALSFLEHRHPERWWTVVPAIDALVAQGHERWLRAELLALLGRHEEAIAWYAPLGIWSPGNDISYVAPSRLRLAREYERIGRPDKAIEAYARFVTLWRDADAPLRPTVDSAQFRVEQLRGGAVTRR
jgi:DNA-binding SARP family transcriptional activator